VTGHLVPLGKTGWSVWRWVLLRGAGFAAAEVRALGCDALDPAFARELELEQVDTPPAELARCREATDEIVRRQRASIDRVLRGVARDPRFREALTWQNRSVLHTAIDGLLADPSESENRKARRRHQVIAKYLQRYAVKNDTVGFFGPIGWGRIDLAVRALTATPGPNLIDRRVVGFEDWAIEALAARLSTDPEIRAAFRPRRRPSSWLDGDMLYAPPSSPRRLTCAEAWLIARVDGERSVRELAAAAAADDASGLASADEATRELERLARESVITWGLEMPAELEHPERWLRDALAAIGDSGLRALEPLDRLAAALARVAAAAGDPVALGDAVTNLEHVFRDTTGSADKRGHGQTYAGRQIFVEECNRAIDLRIGGELLAALDPSLALVLDSARWFSHEVARRYRRAFDDTYRHLVDASGPRVPLVMFLAASRPLFSGPQHEMSRFVAEAQAELQRRWSEVIGLDHCEPHTRAIQLASAACRPRMAETFRAPGPGWPRARYHCPDLLIAAASAAEIERGNFLAVLGEIHPGVNTLLTHAAFRMHPERDAISEAYDADMGMVCIAPIQSGPNRAMHSPLSPRHHHVEFGTVRSWRPRDRVHLAGDLYVEDTGGRLHVRSRVSALDYDIIAFMDQYFGAEVMSHFKPLPRRAHSPRIAIDKLVIARERWQFDPDAFVELTRPASETERIRRVARWTRRFGLPRYVFGTVPDEPKPFYVDFSSPIYVDIFVRYLTNATSLGLSEMLPGPDELWLVDSDRRSYTSELRFAAVDPERWVPTIEIDHRE
jgi:hypothetical protein